MKVWLKENSLSGNSDIAKNPEHHDMFLAYNYVKDEPLTREEALKIDPEDPEQLDIIYGSIDDLLKIGDKWVICDKKTTGSIDYFKRATSRASDTHVDQINMYRVLLQKCYNIDATFGCVVYMSNQVSKEDRDKIIPLASKLRPVEETLTKLVEKAKIIKESLTDKVLPPRTKNFLCDGMCPYATMCFTDERESYAD